MDDLKLEEARERGPEFQRGVAWALAVVSSALDDQRASLEPTNGITRNLHEYISALSAELAADAQALQ